MGSVAVLALIGGGIFMVVRRRRHQVGEVDGNDNYAAGPPGTRNHELEQGTIIKPFTYTKSRISTTDLQSLSGKGSRLQSLQNSLLVGQQLEPAFVHGKLAGGDNRNTAGLLSGGSNNSRTRNQQLSENGLSSPLMEIMVDSDRSLRDEVENLRREVERIRHGGVETASEAPPPSYRDDL